MEDLCASYTPLRQGQMITKGALEMLVSVHSTHAASVNMIVEETFCNVEC